MPLKPLDEYEARQLIEDAEVMVAGRESMEGAAKRMEMTTKTLSRRLRDLGRDDLLARLQQRNRGE